MSPKTVAEAKSLAKALRAECAARGAPISHAQALEWIAHQNGSLGSPTYPSMTSEICLQVSHPDKRSASG